MREMGSFKRLIVLGFSLVTIAFETLIYSRFWYEEIFRSVSQYLGFEGKGHYLAFVIYATLLFGFSSMYGGLNIGYLKTTEVVFSQVFATIAVNVITYGQTSLMSWGLLDPSIFVVMTIIQALGVVAWSLIAQQIYKSLFSARRLLVVHSDRPYKELIRKFETRKDKYVIDRYIHVQEGLEAVYAEATERYDAVVLGDMDVHTRNKIFKFCYGKGIRVYILPNLSDVILSGAERLHLFDTPIYLTREYTLTIEERVMKRMIDVICSGILLLLTLPIMIVTAIVIKLYDGGPIIYKQIRCTRDMDEFGIMKFRSMRVDAEKDGVARLASKNDDRITPIGKFIRKVRIDELPQLLNIFVGQMSFIGPRPERPEIIAQYMEIMPEFSFRTKVKAGLAGFAQVYGKYNTTPYDKLKLDLIYIENYSIWLDIKLMLLTLKILFWPDSTEGVEQDQITAFKHDMELKRDEKVQDLTENQTEE
ncbi:MAG: exopolysaccharide biosynthesis polyprenyl glycosylphosphotransferase [Lachnospiraceae bacterium]